MGVARGASHGANVAGLMRAPVEHGRACEGCEDTDFTRGPVNVYLNPDGEPVALCRECVARIDRREEREARDV